jgi:hypothetical protein
MIVIAGLPRSGNHILRSMILRCIRMKRRDPTWQGEKCTVWHGAESPPVFEEGKTRFVIPVRNPCYRMLSMRAAALPPGRWPEDACRKGVFNAVVALKAPVKLVSYEAFVEAPEDVGQDLIAWLGYAWMPFPVGINAEAPLNGAIFDGNEKYRRCPEGTTKPNEPSGLPTSVGQPIEGPIVLQQSALPSASRHSPT